MLRCHQTTSHYPQQYWPSNANIPPNKLVCHYNDVIMTHNNYDSVSNHQSHGCLLNRLFRRRSKITSKLRVTGLCVGNSPGPVNSPHKGPVTRKMFPFDDVIMLAGKLVDIHSYGAIFATIHTAWLIISWMKYKFMYQQLYHLLCWKMYAKIFATCWQTNTNNAKGWYYKSYSFTIELPTWISYAMNSLASTHSMSVLS